MLQNDFVSDRCGCSNERMTEHMLPSWREYHQLFELRDQAATVQTQCQSSAPRTVESDAKSARLDDPQLCLDFQVTERCCCAI